MELGYLRWLPLLVALSLAACSDGEKNDDPPLRPAYLERTPALIAADALSDMPSADFNAVRGRLNASVEKDRRDYAQSFLIAGGRGAALATDPVIAAARTRAASSLGVMLDPLKVADVALANATLDQLLTELQARFPGAQSCANAGPKAENCAIALLLIEVKRSEAATVLIDSGVPFVDASAPYADASTAPDGSVNPDASIADATVADGGRPIPTGPVTPIDCLSRDTTGAREVMGTVSASETWSGKIWVRGSVYFRGGTLTIMPGTEIFMDINTSIYVGYGGAATLVADGTLAAPIRICGKTGDIGHWGRFSVQATVTTDSVLRNVLFADGGRENASSLELEAPVLVQNVQVRNTKHSGVTAADFAASSAQLSVEGSAGPAVILTSAGAITRFPQGGFLVNNADNTVHLRFARIDGAIVVPKLGVPYVQEQAVYQYSGEITFQPGVDYRFNPDVLIYFSYGSESTAVHVNGTQAEPVLFRGVTDASANWRGIQVGMNTMLSSNFTWMQIRQAGSGTNYYALNLDGPLKVNDVAITGGALGVRVGANGFIAGSANLTVSNTQSFPITAHPDALVTLPAGGKFENNATNQVRIEGSTLKKGGTIPDLGIPYFISQALYFYAGANYTIAPGSEFVIGAGLSINIGYNGGAVTFVANGTADAPIRFIGLTPTPGFWNGIVVDANVSTDSSFNYVQIGHGGRSGATDTGMLVLNTNIPVMNSRFFDSPAWGIEKRMANPTDYMLTNTFENVAMGGVRVYR